MTRSPRWLNRAGLEEFVEVAERVLPWLRAAAAEGSRVLVGDPGRKYLPPPSDVGLVELAAWRVHTTTTLEDREIVEARVFALPPR